MAIKLLIPEETRARAADYLLALRTDEAKPSKYLAIALGVADVSALTDATFLDVLINTKIPQIFAESAVVGDGSDCNLTELGILGDISISVPVTIFDNGHHTTPMPHQVAFPGILVFTPGTLLKNGRGFTPADWEEVTNTDGALCADGYFRLYERRLLPVFHHVETIASESGKPALVTIPGLDCGCFAGPFSGKLGAVLQSVLERILEMHGS